jgi:predicted Zn-ribbon and HTH transcriptional regulator
MAPNLAFGGERIISEIKNCPKCNGEMVQGEFLKNLPKVIVFPKQGLRSFDKLIPTYCKKCGFMEIYKEMKEEIEI